MMLAQWCGFCKGTHGLVNTCIKKQDCLKHDSFSAEIMEGWETKSIVNFLSHFT